MRVIQQDRKRDCLEGGEERTEIGARVADLALAAHLERICQASAFLAATRPTPPFYPSA